jgi:hypothetical protein
MKSCPCRLNLFYDLLRFLVLGLRSKNSLAAENLFLRKQLAFYQERRIRPRRIDCPTQLTLVWLSRWFNWRSALMAVTPRTFIGWHRNGFELFWRWKCQSGRPRIPPHLQHLIRRMAGENCARKNSASVVGRGPGGCTRGEVRSRRSAPRFGLVGRNDADDGAEARGNLMADREAPWPQRSVWSAAVVMRQPRP